MGVAQPEDMPADTPSRSSLPAPVLPRLYEDRSYDPRYDHASDSAPPQAEVVTPAPRRRARFWSRPMGALPMAALLIGASAQVVFFSSDAFDAGLARVDSSTPTSMRAAAEARAERRAIKAELRRVRAESRRARSASRRAERAAARIERARLPAPEHHEIECEYSTIDRALIEDALADTQTLARQARVIPYVRDGVVEGYKLYGLREASLPALAGFKNGDLVTEVNGQPLAAGGYAHRFDTVPSAPPRLISFTVRRRGKPLRKVIELR